MLQLSHSWCMLCDMTTRTLAQIEKEVEVIKAKLLLLGEMRPGALTQQYRDPKKKEAGYFQLSYTHKMKSRTEYIRPVFVREVRTQVKVYKDFRKLVEKWIDLSIEYSRLKMDKGSYDKQKG